MIFFAMLACNTLDNEKSNPEPIIESALPELKEEYLDEVDVELSEESPSRQLKRMSVSQVRDAMIQISDGIPWGSMTESNWDVYSDTLGVADYQSRVVTDRSPSVMFQKFLDDAASGTCLGWIRDSGSSLFNIVDLDSVERADIRSGIIELRWHIQGKDRAKPSIIIDDYEIVFFTTYQRSESVERAWQSVCVAMFTHPDFFMY